MPVVASSEGLSGGCSGGAVSMFGRCWRIPTTDRDDGSPPSTVRPDESEGAGDRPPVAQIRAEFYSRLAGLNLKEPLEEAPDSTLPDVEINLSLSEEL